MDPLLTLPGELVLSICIEWIVMEDLARLDSAVCNHKTRPLFLDLLGSRDQEYDVVWFEGRCGVVAGEKEGIYEGDIVSWSHRRALSVSPNNRRSATIPKSRFLQ